MYAYYSFAIRIFTVLLFTTVLSGCIVAKDEPEQYMEPKFPGDVAANQLRITELTSLANAIYQYQIDRGVLPGNISIERQEISSDQADICSFIVPDYIVQLPSDPSLNEVYRSCPEQYATGYFIQLNDDETISLFAPSAEGGVALEVRR